MLGNETELINYLGAAEYVESVVGVTDKTFKCRRDAEKTGGLAPKFSEISDERGLSMDMISELHFRQTIIRALPNIWCAENIVFCVSSAQGHISYLVDRLFLGARVGTVWLPDERGLTN